MASLVMIFPKKVEHSTGDKHQSDWNGEQDYVSTHFLVDFWLAFRADRRMRITIRKVTLAGEVVRTEIALAPV